MSGYLSQSAVEFSALGKAVRKALEAQSWRDYYWYQLKYDGVSGIVLTGSSEGSGQMLSRTGEVAASCDHIITHCRRIFGFDKVVFGEVYKFGWEQPEISGAYRRQSPQPELQFVAFDMVWHREWDGGMSPRIYSERWHEAATLFSHSRDENDTGPILLASSWLPEHMDEQRIKCLATTNPGYDGYIRRDPRSTWTPGKDRRGVVLKFKPTVTFDLECTGVEEGKGKYKGTLGALLLRFRDGKVVKASGMSDKHRAEWWAEPPIGSIHEIEAMAVSTKGLLREPRWKGQRFDKLKPDF